MPDLTEPTRAIRVAVVDDQPLFASGLRMLIEAQPDLACVGTAVDGREALELVARESPDVVLMDLRMPVMNGLEATARILEGVSPDDLPRVVALTTIQRDEAVFGALKAGAYAFLTKDATPDDVITTIRAAFAGDPVPTAGAALDVVHEFAVPPTAPPQVDPLAPLSPREREMFTLVAKGLSNTEIATEAYLSEATVKSHVRSVLQKLGMRNRVQIVVFAYENGVVSGPDRRRG
ncbi:response regulator transcription factor [Frigoribacterium faeni]|uniref:response regulator n=1 Tax=Frigoribacterium faeni TaxID=145483 RepID=UPI001FAD7A7E|nr:response regulator transcription factor [Frigoribacterium faeni]MCJ0701689.1 response regulator transcription factor [Frigoribacterium faeni]